MRSYGTIGFINPYDIELVFSQDEVTRNQPFRELRRYNFLHANRDRVAKLILREFGCNKKVLIRASIYTEFTTLFANGTLSGDVETQEGGKMWPFHSSCKQQTFLYWNIFWAKGHKKQCKYGDYGYHTSEQYLHLFSTSKRLQSQSGTNLHLVLVSLILNGNKGYVSRCKLYLKWTQTCNENSSPQETNTLRNISYITSFRQKNCKRNCHPRYSTSMVSEASNYKGLSVNSPY